MLQKAVNEAVVDRTQVRSVRRAAVVLKAFTAGDGLLGINELARRIGLLPSTVCRIVSSLEAEELLEKDLESGKYRLGLEVLRLGRVALRHNGIEERAVVLMDELAKSTGEAVVLGTLIDGQVTYLERIESRHLLRTDIQVGKTMPAHCTATGKMLLSLLSEDQLDHIVQLRGLKRLTPKTICSPVDLKKELRQIRQQGYSIDDEEQALGVRCIGAPIFDHLGRPMAGLAVSGPAGRLTMDRLMAIKDNVLRTAEHISRRLGWTPDTKDVTLP